MKKIEVFFFYLYTVMCFLLPAADIIINKKLIFIMLLLITIINMILNKRNKINFKVLLKYLLLMIIPIIFSIVQISKGNENTFFIITSCFPLVLVLTIDNKIDSLKILKDAGLLLSLAVVTIALMPIISEKLGLLLNGAFLYLNSGFLGERVFGQLKLIMVHFRTSPILLLPGSFFFIDFCEKPTIPNFIKLFIIMIAIIFSASRGLMLFTFLSLLFISISNYNKINYKRILILLLIIMFFGLNLIITKTNMFNASETSNSVKIGHFESFNELINREPGILLFGNGTGSTYYTKGFHRQAFQTELTFLDMIRYWGIIITTIFLLTIIIPIKKPILSYYIPFVLYMINAGTNPLIFNSTGMLVITILILTFSKKSKDQYVR